MFTRWSDAKNDKLPPEHHLAAFPPLEARAAGPTSAPSVILVPPPQEAIVARPTPPPMPPELQAQIERADQGRSVIGQDLLIEGQSITIRCKGALEINGTIQAELHSQKLIVGQSGKVEGSIAADSVDIWGRVSGTVMGARVVLHPSAEVEGDIHARSLSVADGASFEGRSRKVTDEASIAPRLEAGSPSVRGPSSEPLPFPQAAAPVATL